MIKVIFVLICKIGVAVIITYNHNIKLTNKKWFKTLILHKKLSKRFIYFLNAMCAYMP